jgi:protease-4
MAADHVLADPLTITGSIGVVAGKFEVQGLLDKVRVRREVLSYGAHSGMFSSTSGWSPGERERLRAQLLSFYDAFVDKAALGRGRPRDELERHARGRIWTGGQAKERGLVDSVGGVRDALREAARRAGLGTAWETWVYAPPHPGLLERLMRLAPTVGGSRAAARAGGDQTLVQARLPVEIRIR